VLLAALSALTVTAGGFLAAGASSPGGALQVFIAEHGTANGGGPVTVTGVVGDYGTTSPSFDRDGTKDPAGNYGDLLLRHGHIELDLKALSAAAAKVTPTLYKPSCSAYQSVDAKITIVGGTGAYRGISGTLSANETAAVIFPRYASGAKKGRCDLAGAVIAKAAWGALIASGTVRLASR
jgi:hypothetical protein